MPSQIVRRTWKVEGVLTNATSAVLSDPTGTYGIKRDDTGATVVADGTAMTNPSTGVYEYTFTAIVGVAYTAYVEVVYNGATYHLEHDIPAIAAGTELQCDYTDLKVAIADYLAWTRNSEGTGIEWTTDEVNRLDAIIKAGLLQVYFPATGHEWSWMTPVSELETTAPYETGTIQIAAGVVTLTGGTWPSWATDGDLVVGSNNYSVASRDSDTQLTLNDTSVTQASGTSYELQRSLYELPSNFAGFSGETITFVQGQAELYPPIEVIPDNRLRSFRQLVRINETEWETPRFASIRAKTFDATVGQRRQLALYPTPQRVWNLRLEYKVEPAMLDATNRFPLGNADIGELILQSCLAIAEQRYRDGDQGLHAEMFNAKLAAAIENDARAFTPDSLGYNADRSESRSGLDQHDGVALHSFNGTYYYDRNP